MKHIIIITSSLLLMSSYISAAEYPHHKKLSRQIAFRKENDKSPFIILQNKLNYDITTVNLVINPGESKKINLQENLELTVFTNTLDDKLTLKFQDPLPHNVCFTQKSDLIEVTCDGQCLKKYICK